MSGLSGVRASSRTVSALTPSRISRALRSPLQIARGTFDRLPIATQAHARAAVTEGVAALRSLTDGVTDATERTIDRIGTFIRRQ